MSEHSILPYGKISSVEDLGHLVRQYRSEQDATQTDLAAFAGVGVRFISELENGKPTVELGKVLKVLATLGLELRVRPRSWQSDSK